MDIEAGRKPTPVRREDFMVTVGRAMEWVLDWVMRIIGPILICVATFLILAVVRIFFKTVVYFVATPWTTGYAVHSAIVLWISGNILFNYFACVVTGPGYALTEVELNDKIQNGEVGDKKTVEMLLKPPRSHYCNIMKRQVLRMDHFCPWVGNCVGFFNYRYFFLFLTYLAIGCWYGVSICIVPFYTCMHHHRHAVAARNPICASRAHITFAFVITLSVGIAVSLMLAFHVYLVLSAQTTIEFYYNKFTSRGRTFRGELAGNQYDLGRTKNWHAVFGAGAYWWSWLVPALTSPPGDGFTFMSRSDSSRQRRAETAAYKERLQAKIRTYGEQVGSLAEQELQELAVDF